MDNYRKEENVKAKKSCGWIAWVLILLIIIGAVGFYVWDVVLAHAPGTIRDGILYLNIEKMYVYSTLNSALADTMSENGQPCQLKDVLPEILEANKLAYLEGTTVGICVDQQITQEQIPSEDGKSDRIVYKLGDYFIAETLNLPD